LLLNTIRKIDDYKFKVLLAFHSGFLTASRCCGPNFCFICIEQLLKRVFMIFSFVLAKFYEMEDIIATTSVNTVTEEIFDRQSLKFSSQRRAFFVRRKKCYSLLKVWLSNSYNLRVWAWMAGNVTNNL